MSLTFETEFFKRWSSQWRLFDRQTNRAFPSEELVRKLPRHLRGHSEGLQDVAQVRPSAHSGECIVMAQIKAEKIQQGSISKSYQLWLKLCYFFLFSED